MLGFGPPANRRARQEWWRRQIQRQQDGTLSIAEFCRRLGVSTVTFYAWKRRFREAPSASPPISERPAAKPSAANGISGPAFLPVSIREAGPDGQLEIELTNACIVRLKGSVDPALLRVAIRAAGRLGEGGRGAD
jgi:transposase-like protein